MVVMTKVARSFLAALFVVALPAPGWTRAQADEDDVRNCYSVHGEARYGALAYKHVVIVTNRCEVELQCRVWTDVDPEPKQSVSVGPKGTAEVIVRAVSPARSVPSRNGAPSGIMATTQGNASTGLPHHTRTDARPISHASNMAQTRATG